MSVSWADVRVETESRPSREGIGSNGNGNVDADEMMDAGTSVMLLSGWETGHCGYCGSHRSRVFGAWAYQLTPADYQKLIDAGWRRSGRFLYFPDWKETCCLQLSIRLDVTRFRMSRSQRNITNRMNRYISPENGPSPQSNWARSEKANSLVKEREPVVDHLKVVVRQAIDLVLATYSAIPSAAAVESSVFLRERMGEKKNEHVFATNAAFILSGLLSATPGTKRQQDRVASQMLVADDLAKAIRSVGAPGLLRVEICNPGFVNIVLSAIRDRRDSGSSKSPKRAGRKTLPSKIERLPCGHELSVELIPACYDSESFNLFCKYQVATHGDKLDELSEDSFINFLVESPLTSFPIEGIDSFACGSYHLRYFLDRKLFACSVIDVLPSGVSSVYCFYDPSLKGLSPGVFSALYEIDWIRKLIADSLGVPFRYYYLGYYIHGHPKMEYKARYQPSELRCPATGRWVDYEEARTRLNEDGMGCQLAQSCTVEETDGKVENATSPSNYLSNFDFSLPGRSMLVDEFARLAGADLATRVVLLAV